MRYYVVADIHSFYDEMVTALKDKGFYEDKEPHKLIILGDLFDRGDQSVEMQNFVLDLMAKDMVILIRGNHEDLMMDLLNNAKYYFNSGIAVSHHWSNGTVKTAADLAGVDIYNTDYQQLANKLAATPYITKIIPAMLNYYETEHYVFVHGWIPCDSLRKFTGKTYLKKEGWRESHNREWEDARWINGMEAYQCGVKEEGKTIVCGHWHCSWGHCYLEGDGPEFAKNSNFDPFIADGIIALDACTGYSRRVNCVVLND